MRPPHFYGGNVEYFVENGKVKCPASMRPPHFYGGNFAHNKA